jgi:hypothetical protein
VARLILESAGFVAIEDDIALRDLGVQVAFRARDRRGGWWLFDLAGAFSSTRPGLRRGDGVWKVLGRAAVVGAARAGQPERDQRDIGPLILLSTDLPLPGTPASRALAVAVSPPGGPLFDVIDLGSPDARARLEVYATEGSGGPAGIIHEVRGHRGGQQ